MQIASVSRIHDLSAKETGARGGVRTRHVAHHAFQAVVPGRLTWTRVNQQAVHVYHCNSHGLFADLFVAQVCIVSKCTRLACGNRETRRPRRIVSTIIADRVAASLAPRFSFACSHAFSGLVRSHSQAHKLTISKSGLARALNSNLLAALLDSNNLLAHDCSQPPVPAQHVLCTWYGYIQRPRDPVRCAALECTREQARFQALACSASPFLPANFWLPACYNTDHKFVWECH